MNFAELGKTATKFSQANPAMTSAIGTGANTLLSSAPNTNTNLMNSGVSPMYSKYANKAAKGNQVIDTLGTVGLSSGNPYAMAAGAVLKLSNMTDKMFKNKDGIYRSNAAMVAANLNPITAVKNIATGQMFNYGKIRSEVEKAKQFMQQSNDYGQISQNVAAGEQMRASIPEYTAPAYGRKGMKLTKYSKNC